MPSHEVLGVLRIGSQAILGSAHGENRKIGLRVAVFLTAFLLFAVSALVFNFSREPVYRAVARLSVEPPGVVEDQSTRTQFALSEAQVLRGSGLVKAAVEAFGSDRDIADLERRLAVEVLPQTTVIELRAEGAERSRLVEALTAWITAYLDSRKATDQYDRTEALEEARHAAREASRIVEAKRREMEAFRQRHGITSVERDENLGAARLKGVHLALNEAATKEVSAEARLKSIDESIAA